MKRLLPVLLISYLALQGPFSILRPIARPKSGVANGLTWTLIQHPNNVSCTTVGCSVTTSSTTAGNLLIAWSAVKYAGTGFATQMKLASVTDNGTSETWTHCPNSVENNGKSSDGTLYALDCYYVLSAAGGATSVTATWTLTGLTTATQKVDAEVIEVHPSGTIYYDTGNAFFNNTSCTSCQAPAGLLSGTSDFVSQATIFPGALVTAISAPYSNPFDADNANQVFGAFAGALNQASYSLPSWSEGVAHNPNYMSFVAFGGNASPAPTGNLFIDFSACTNGVAITTTCGASSTVTGWGTNANDQDASSMGTGVTACTSVISSNLPSATTVNGVSKTGGSTLDFCGITSATGTAIGHYDVGLGDGFNGEPAQFNPVTVGYTFRSDCPLVAADCGAILRLVSDIDAAVAHANPLGDGTWCLESTASGAPCNHMTPSLAYAPNTNYRINVYMEGVTGGNDKMTICADGPGGAVLATVATANTSSAANRGINAVQIGITGEEPTTVGYHYYFRNIVVGGVYSTTGCF